MVVLQFVSDLHLEKYPERNFSNLITPSAPYLALCGDIGNALNENNHLSNFLRDASCHFEHVFYIAGNHEYYGTSIYEGNVLLKKICNKFKNVHFLCNTFFIFDNVLIFGSTLWSYIDPSKQEIVQNEILDYKLIEGLSIRDTMEMNKITAIMILDLLNRHADKEFIVLSHHAPYKLGTSNPKYADSPTNCAFASDLSSLFYHPNLKFWIHGHTHWNHRTEVYETIISANHKGNTGECNNYIKDLAICSRCNYDRITIFHSENFPNH